MDLLDTLFNFMAPLLFAVFVAPVVLFWIWMKVDRFVQSRRGYIIGSLGHNHDIAIIYEEGLHKIYLKGRRETMTIDVPSAELWQAQMPEWARDRRAEIMGRIYSHCRRSRYTFREEMV